MMFLYLIRFTQRVTPTPRLPTGEEVLKTYGYSPTRNIYNGMYAMAPASHHDISDTAGATMWAQISLFCPLPQILHVLGMTSSEITPGNVVVTTELVKGTLASYLDDSNCLYDKEKTKLNRMVQICLREGLRALLHLNSMGYSHDNVTEESIFILEEGPSECAKLGRIGCDVKDGCYDDHIQFIEMVFQMFQKRGQQVPFEIVHFCTIISRRGRLDLVDLNHPCLLNPTQRLTFRTLCCNILCERYKVDMNDPNIGRVLNGLSRVPIPLDGLYNRVVAVQRSRDPATNPQNSIPPPASRIRSPSTKQWMSEYKAYTNEHQDPGFDWFERIKTFPEACFFNALANSGATYWSTNPMSFLMYCNNIRKHYQIKWEGVNDADLDMALTHFFPDLMLHMFTMDSVKMSGILLDPPSDLVE